MSKSSVYIFGLRKKSGVCKIGVSNDVEKRLKQISTGTPYEPFVYHQFYMQSEDAAYKAEKAAHKELAEWRMNGEWFKVTPISARTTVATIAARFNDNAKLWWDRVRARNEIERERIASLPRFVPSS